MTMRKTTEGEKVPPLLSLSISEQLKDPDFAGGTCLLSHIFVKMEKKLLAFVKCRKNYQITD
jgi:hypothetical protein